MTSSNGLIKAATRYEYAVIGLSSPDGAWAFGNNGIANDETPMSCQQSDSKDIAYLQQVFLFLEKQKKSTDGSSFDFDLTRVFTEGFSQNSMFAMYTAMCFADRVNGVWQGGSGIAVRGSAPTPPGMQVGIS